jgi:hypothetical protein
VEPGANKVKIKIFTLAFRKIYEDDSQPVTSGPRMFSLDWKKLGNLSNELYYLVLTEERAGGNQQTVMKLLIIK